MVDAGVDADRRKRYSAARRSRVGRQRSGRSGMKILAVHPSGLMYTRVFLTLEPLGLELIAGAARAAGHEVRIVDLQVERPARLWRDIARTIKYRDPNCFVFVGGHSASFVAADILTHGAGAIDCVIKGEGEVSVP